MEIKNKKVILRDFQKSDIEDRILWETVETEWQQWDAPWENDSGTPFDIEGYRRDCLIKLAKKKDSEQIRYRFEICQNNEDRKHIGWCNAYSINADFVYDCTGKYLAIGISIPDLASRRKAYATFSWDLFIQYLLGKGFEGLYSQTWSGNERVLGLMKKVGFRECHRVPKEILVRGRYYDSLTLKLNLLAYEKFSKNLMGEIK